MRTSRFARVFALALTLLILLPVFSACGESKENADEPEGQIAAAVSPDPAAAAEIGSEEPEETELMDDVPAANLDGAQFRILSCFHHQDTYSFVASDEMNGTPLNDALYLSKMYIEGRFNVRISSVDSGDTSGNMQAVKNAVTGGDNSFEITVGHDKNTVGLGTQGYLFNVRDIDAFDFSRPWWPQMAADAWTINGKLYAVSNYLSYCGLHWTRMILFNKDLAANLGIEAPYDTVREGGWTLDALKTLADQATNDLDGDGRMLQSDRFGFAGFRGSWYALQEALALPLYRRDADGQISLDFDVDKADIVVSKVRAMTTPDRFFSAGEFYPSMLEGGNFLFAYMQLKDVYAYVNECEAHAGFLTSPKRDELQTGYINCCTDAPWAIPKIVTPEQQDIIGAVVEAMSCNNYKTVLPAYYEVTMKARIADAPDDAEMLQLIAETRTIGFAYAFQLIGNDFLENMYSNSVGVASFLKKLEQKAEKGLAKLLDSYAD